MRTNLGYNRQLHSQSRNASSEKPLRMDSSPSQNPQIQSLIERAGAGDEAAYARLIERVSERLMRMSHMMLRNYPRLRRWEQTDDVFQNAMIRLHRSLTEVRPESPRAFFGLAATQIRRTLIDLVRHHFGPEGEAGH
jgi:RNA polymerase sigma-70 factor (ECF subfamily)